MPLYRRYDFIGLVLGSAALLAWASIHSEFRLRPKMPAEFFNPAEVPPKKLEEQQKAAEAYWKLAITDIQLRYSYARSLPEQPPADFFVRTSEAGAAALDPALRAHYWKKLREVWNIAALWERRYEWSTVSITEAMESAAQWLGDHLRWATGG